MDINDLTLGQLREIQAMASPPKDSSIDSHLVGKKVIIRTQSAGVHFGTLKSKTGAEVLLSSARRLWFWKTESGGISLSEVATGGIKSESKVCSPVELIWLEAIEIIPCTLTAASSIEAKNEYRA